MARFGRTFVFPYWTHGFLGNTPPVGTTPPPIRVVDAQVERRRYYPPLPPAVLRGPPDTDLRPVILTIDRPERRRPPLDAITLHGPAGQDVSAVILMVDAPARRRQTPDPVIVRVGAVAPTGNFFRLF